MLPSEDTSRQNSCYPSPCRSGGHGRGTESAARVSGADAGAVCRGQSRREGPAVGGGGSRDREASQEPDSGVAGGASATEAAASGPTDPLRARGGPRAGRDLDGGGLSLGGALKSLAGHLAAVGAPAAGADPGDGGGPAGDQCPADRSPPGAAQTDPSPAAVWAHQAGHVAQTSHPAAHRPVG